MLSKNYKELQNQKSTNDDQPKKETSVEYDPYGANQFDHVDKDDIDEVEKARKQYVISQGKQFVGGLAAGIYYTATGEPMANPPADGIYHQGNRQKFANKLNTVSKDPDVQASQHATESVGVMKGQNYAQEWQGEPMPKKPIPIFVKQVKGHAEMDKQAREQGKPHASTNAHKNWDIECHEEHEDAFYESGYISGWILHKIAKWKEIFTKEGEVHTSTGSIDDPELSYHEYTEEDYDRMHSSAQSSYNSESDSEENSVETTIVVTAEQTVEGTISDNSECTVEVTAEQTVEETISDNSESVIVEETISVSQCSSSFFSVQRDNEDDMDYLTRLDTMLN
ncbi:hypothetical protein [Legionella resiliens]|uniref:Uncharacterized protein n=1 Tax=Legionella resiliens TaxID=2905958 RepID=A0ABS8X549_9GAMM|nr:MULTISPECIES: hypothetical protein [unclassified Legionella]MCE0723329.1 hypothetical protein [Legionella sp. 9fVS26]MCE3532482.1 hypothetical protein [Legionella sp. 8cVS16]